MTQVRCYVRTADKTRKAEITLSPEVSVSDIIDTCIEQWSLPRDVHYNLVSVSRNAVLPAHSALIDWGVQEGEILELQPILEAGYGYPV